MLSQNCQRHVLSISALQRPNAQCVDMLPSTGLQASSAIDPQRALLSPTVQVSGLGKVAKLLGDPPNH
eukprot:1360560-Rhodomonas_salina.1